MEKTKELRALLPYGAIKRVSEKLQIPYVSVNAVIDGKMKNIQVLSELGKEIKAEQKRQQKAQQLRNAIAAF